MTVPATPAVDASDTPPVDVEAVRRAAGGVLDPEIRRSLADMDLLDQVEVDADGAAVIRYHLTSPLCPSRFAIDIGRESAARSSRCPASRRQRCTSVTTSWETSSSVRSTANSCRSRTGERRICLQFPRLF